MRTGNPLSEPRRTALPAAALLSALLLPAAAAGQVERYVEGVHYTELPRPVNTRDASKIEVLEAFWYGCAHCFRFESLVVAWERRAPEDVDFVRFPAMWNGVMKIHAQAYYAAEALDAVDELHDAIYGAINVEGERLQNERQIGALFARHGIDGDAFAAAFNSFSVRTRVNQAERRMRDYQIRSTPNMIVNGRYLVSTGENVPTQREMLNVVDFLVDRERRAPRGGG